jgi:hypothetical protein
VTKTKTTITAPVVLLIHQSIRRFILCLNKLTIPESENNQAVAPVKTPRITKRELYGCSRLLATPELANTARNTKTVSGFENVTRKLDKIS